MSYLTFWDFSEKTRLNGLMAEPLENFVIRMCRRPCWVVEVLRASPYYPWLLYTEGGCHTTCGRVGDGL